MKKMANVYERRGTLYISTSSQTTEGLWVDQAPCATYAINAPVETIGRGLNEALARSKMAVVHPKQTEWKLVLAPLLEASGLKSWSTFAKSAKCVGVEMSEDILFKPTRNGGNALGFTRLEERYRRIAPEAAPAALGEALLQAIRDSE